VSCAKTAEPIKMQFTRCWVEWAR